MNLSTLRNHIKTAVNNAAPLTSFAAFDYMEGYLSDQNNIHDRVNPLCILNVVKTTEDRIKPFADHQIRLNFLYNITEAMQTEVVTGSQDYLHTLFSEFDSDIKLVLTYIGSNDALNIKSGITTTRTPYNSTQRLWLIQVEFTLNTDWECFHSI